jgi:hypothetical protein
VLVSFIGKGQRDGSSSGYRTTQYTFPDGWQSPELSVFGIALLTYYEAHLRRSIVGLTQLPIAFLLELEAVACESPYSTA